MEGKDGFSGDHCIHACCDQFTGSVFAREDKRDTLPKSCYVAVSRLPVVGVNAGLGSDDDEASTGIEAAGAEGEEKGALMRVLTNPLQWTMLQRKKGCDQEVGSGWREATIACP